MPLRSIPLLAAGALLSACVVPVPYNERVPKSDTYEQLDAQLHAAPSRQVQLEQLQNLVKLTLPNGVLFAEGSAELDGAGKAALAELAPPLQALIGLRVVVKGFTDNVPLGQTLDERLAGNVELSKARARNVAGFLTAQGVPAPLISSVGLGETHPVASNETATGRAQNRRVEIDIVEAPA